MKLNFLRISPVILGLFMMLGQYNASAQCTNTTPFGSGTLPTSNAIITLTTCAFAGEYSTVNGVVVGSTLNFTASVSTAFLTIRSGSPSGPVVGFGTTPVSVTASAAGPYYLHVNTNSACGTASVCHALTVQCTSCAPPPPPPPPAGCADEAPLVTCGVTVTGTTVGGTIATNLPTCTTTLNTAPGRWYRVYGGGGVITVSLCGSSFDTKVGVFSGTSCSNLTCVVGNDDNAAVCGPGNHSHLTFNSVSGTQYYIYVTGFLSNAGAFTLNVTGACGTPPPPPVPANDECANAIAITCGSTTTGTTSGATIDVVPTCDVTATAPGVWYTIQGDGDVFTLSACGTGFDTKLSVFTGTCGSLVCLEGNSGACSEVEFLSVAGTTYRVLVHGNGTSTGSFSLTSTCAPLCPSPISAPWTVTAINGAVGTAIENCDETLTVSSTGTGTATADKIHFVHQSLTGNGYVVADISSFTNWTYGGVQFRDGLAAGARKVALQTQLGSRVTRELRSTTGGSHTVSQLAAPKNNYVRIARVGDVFTSSVSGDGVNWTQVNQVTLVLPATLNVGFYANSQLAAGGTVNFDAAGVFSGSALIAGADNRNGEMTEYATINAFPNPASSELNINMGHLSGEKVQVTVMNSLGQIALQQNFDNVNDIERLDINKLSSGVYFLQVNNESTQKFIVKK